jgi:signal transduction histidine kinase
LLLFAGGISITFGFFLSHAITSELKELVRGAERISNGDFSTRVPVTGNDEIAQLSKAFNQMSSRLEQAAIVEKNLESARRNLVAWASHDLRTPLTTIRAMLDAIIDDVVTDPETVNRYLRQSQREIERMSVLINDLFELAQLDAGYKDFDCEWITVSDLVSDILEGFTAKAKSLNIQLSGHVDSDADTLWAAPDKLSRILDNLVSNALRYTGPGGEVHVEATSSDGNIQFKVRDTGAGIPENEIDLIFDRFYRGEKSRVRDEKDQAGVGMGLAIVKGLVEAHNGSIEVASMPGEGTTFLLTFPKNP